MVVENMIRILKNRTGVRTHDQAVLDELNSAKDEVFQRVFLMNKDIEVTFETELSPSAVQVYDLGTAITAGEIWQVKQVWVKYSGESEFTLAEHHDCTSPEFRERDQLSAQVIHPLFYDVINFDQLRFGPTLPSSTTLRIDWTGNPPDFALDTEAVTTMPAPLHSAILDQATAQIMTNKDDTRSQEWELRAARKLQTALTTLAKRDASDKPKTRSFSRRHM